VTKNASNYVIELKNLSEEYDKIDQTLNNIKQKQLDKAAGIGAS